MVTTMSGEGFHLPEKECLLLRFLWLTASL